MTNRLTSEGKASAGPRALKARAFERKRSQVTDLPHQSGGHYRLSCGNLNLGGGRRRVGERERRRGVVVYGVCMLQRRRRRMKPGAAKREEGEEGRKEKRNSPRISGRTGGTASMQCLLKFNGGRGTRREGDEKRRIIKEG